MLYACDHAWWAQHEGVPRFEGIKVGQDHHTLKMYPDVLKAVILHGNDQMQFDVTGCVGWGGNSGFHAINLAAQFGAAKIIMVGMDLRVDAGFHFFGEHAYRQQSPSASNCLRWRGVLDRAAPVLQSRGIRVINCSPVSTLTAYEKMDFERALEC